LENTYTFWTYIDKEIAELQTDFEELFDGLKLFRDYEDTWEWLEGKTVDDNFEINISRQHNWETGEYEKELVMIVKTELEEIQDKLGSELKDKLGSIIYFGERTYLRGNDFRFQKKKEYK
jgi:hypothetical protein